MNDERLYAKVAEEVQQRGPNTGLWAKAYAESNGVESQAKALYLRYRVAQLAESERQAVEAEAVSQAELRRHAAEREEEKRKLRARAEGITPIHLVLLGLIVFFLVAAIVGSTRA